MRAAGHEAIGTAAGFVAGMMPAIQHVENVTLLGFGLSALGAWLISGPLGAIGAAIPDLAESSKRRGPNHRSIFHSIAMLAGMIYLAFLILTDRLATEDHFYLIVVLPMVFGYISHLVVDAFSPKGLPFLL